MISHQLHPPRPRRRSSTLPAAFVALCLASLLAGAVVERSAAAFRHAGGSNLGNRWNAGVLQPPSGLQASTRCVTTPRVPTFRSASQATSSNFGGPSTVTLTKPTGVQAGDLLIAGIAYHSSAHVTAPAGWISFGSGSSDGQLVQHVFGRFATSGEPNTYTFSSDGASGSAQGAGGLLAYSNVRSAGTVVAWGSQSNPLGSTVTAPSLEATAANQLLVTFFGARTQGTFTPPEGMTERFDLATTGGTTGKNASASGADVVLAGAGPTGARTATIIGPTGEGVGQAVVLQAAVDQQWVEADLSWTASPSTHTTGYRLERWQSGVAEQGWNRPASPTTYTDGPLTPGATYRYRVRATASLWRSPWHELDVLATGC